MPLLLTVAGLSLGAGFAAAQIPSPTVTSARLFADLTGADGGATVRVEYGLAGVEPGAAVPVQLLGIGNATTGQIRADGREPVVLWPASGSLRAASIPITGDPAREVGLILEYRIDQAVETTGAELRVRIPVAVVRLPPAQGAGSIFHATVTVPDAWSLTEGFPSGLRGDGEGLYAADLPVVPSVVRFRGRTDGAWRPGLPLALDLAIVSALAAFALAGWRHLRRAAA